MTRRLVEIRAGGNLQELGDLLDDSYRGHTSAGTRDREALRKRIESFRASYSDVQFTVVDQFVAGDRVASRLEATAIENASQSRVRMLGIARFAAVALVSMVLTQ